MQGRLIGTICLLACAFACGGDRLNKAPASTNAVANNENGRTDNGDANNTTGPNGRINGVTNNTTTPDPNSDPQNSDVCLTFTPDIEVLAPNVYIVFDKSGSMGQWYGCMDPTATGCCDGCTTEDCCLMACCLQHQVPYPIDQARAALDTVADRFADRIRLGFAAYPLPVDDTGMSCESTELLPLGQHDAASIKRSYQSLEANGGTPTGSALNDVLVRGGLHDPSDPFDLDRSRAVILITDGEPNLCEEEHPAVSRALGLQQDGAPVYVVGFASGANEATLNSIAEAGGTDNPADATRRFFVANDTAGLVDVITQISSAVVSCEHVLNPRPDSGSAIHITIGGAPLADDAWAYDPNTGTLTFSSATCGQLQNPGVAQTLEIVVGCEG